MLTGRVPFGPFEADIASGELRREGVVVPLQDLPFRLLLALLERPGQVVTRAELTERLWGSGTFVDAVAGLNTAVAKLREALEDDAARPAFIETVPKRGYRFIGPVGFAVEPPAARAPRRARRVFAWAAVSLVVLSILGLAVYQLGADKPKTRVAVLLFDNETGEPAFAPLAQGLTDATVFELTAQPRLAIIGNAAVLRTSRPFRDLETIRDALRADFMVIGQVQTVDDGIIVRAHLIRARDLAHVWVDTVRATPAGEGALQSAVAGRIATAVSTHAQAAR